MPKGQFTPITEKDEQKIRDEYLSKPIKQLADEIGTTFGVVMRRLNKWGLTIPKEVVERNRAARQFKPGNIPYSAGKKQVDIMSQEAIERTKKTRFKKGRLPHNTNPEGNGAISIRRDTCGRDYKYIRTSLGVWELQHRVIWEQNFGKIPEGMIVTFKDENSLNTDPSNLKLMSRTENMLRNSSGNFPPEIIPTLVLMNELKTKINKLENGKK